MEATILEAATAQAAAEPINETALLNSLFGEAPAPAETAAEPIGSAHTGAELEPLPEPQRAMNEERFISLIDEIRRDREANSQFFRQLLSPQQMPDEIPEEERMLNERLKTALDPLKQENESLKQQVTQLRDLETKRATDIFIGDMQAKYPDFNPQAVADEMFNIALELYNDYTGEGMTHEQAAAQAEKTTRKMFDNPKGAERLYFMIKSNIPAASARQRIPDQHVSGQNTPTPPKSWKDKMKSNNEAEQNSVFNDLFRS